MQQSAVPVGDVSINAALAVLWEAGANHLLKSPGIPGIPKRSGWGASRGSFLFKELL